MLKTISLLAILPALTFAFFIPFPVSGPSHSDVNKSALVEHAHVANNNNNNNNNEAVKICSFVDYVDMVLCNSSGSNHENQNHTKELNNNNNKNEKPSIEFNLEMDPKNLCPLFELVDKSFCKSGKHIKVGIEKENIDPKDLCPLLELIETKLCS
jgi:hypothetical protein